jgi:hypothetical protein
MGEVYRARDTRLGRDGQRFLLNLPTESRSVDVFNVVLNWTAEVARE